jgi:CubicO group peptidase (beta-lactamase class C family)
MSRIGVDTGFESVDATLREWERERGFSGAVLVTRDGSDVFGGCYGMANRADAIPITPDTRFGLASVTKMFTAAAVASLVRAGRLAFATRVMDMLPAGRRPATLHPDVSVHHLLSHTSGIADYFEEGEGESVDYATLWRDRPNYRITRPVDFLPMFANLPPHDPPGQRFRYSNASYILLGLVIEEVTGVPYIDAVTELVLGPAGLGATGFFALDEAWPRVAVGYLPPREPGGPWRSNIYAIPAVGGSDGGAFSTVADLDRFLRSYADGGLLGEALSTEMLTPRCVVADGVDMGYGVFLYNGGRFGHDGRDPGCEAQLQYIPEQDASVIVLCNVNGFAQRASNMLIETVLEGR